MRRRLRGITLRHQFQYSEMSNQPENIFSEYHAHVYFEEQSVAHATFLCEQAGTLFGVTVGRVHRKLVGPHPRWSCQLAFYRSQFNQLIPWLEQNRNGLSVLVHGLTGDNLKDHTTHASWLGAEIPLDLAVFGT